MPVFVVIVSTSSFVRARWRHFGFRPFVGKLRTNVPQESGMWNSTLRHAESDPELYLLFGFSDSRLWFLAPAQRRPSRTTLM